MLILLRIFVLINLFLCPISGVIAKEEESLKYSPNVELGWLDYNFQFDDVVLADGLVGDGINVSDSLFMGGVGVTIKYDNIYLGLSFRKTTEGSDSGQQFLTDIVNGSPVAATHDLSSRFDRSELDALLGYQFFKNKKYGSAVYAGYRYAETSFENRTSTVGNILNGVLIAPSEEVFNGVFDIDFKYHGPFLGLSIDIPMPFFYSTLTVNPILSYFLGQFDQKFEPDQGARDPVIDSANAEGTSLGFSVGVNWAIPITDNLAFSVIVDRSQFEFETSSDGSEADFEESFNRARIKLEYTF